MKTKDPEREELAELDGQYAIRTQDKEEQARHDVSEDIPAFKVKLDLTEEQKTRLCDQFKEEFEALKAEREALGLSSKWKSLDNQYDGVLKKNSKLSFNLHTHQSKIKVDSIVRSLNEAFLQSSPMVDVSPRPEMWAQQEKQSLDICEKQQQFIQYEMEENIKPERDLTLIGLCAVKKFVGIGKLEWCYEKEKRKRYEVYEGKNEIVGIDQQTGQPTFENKALKEFTSNYPDWEAKGYGQYVKRIAAEKTVYLVVNYLDTVDNTAKLRHVSIEDFYVKNSTNYNEGLAKAHLIVERQSMTWWELKQKEENDEFEDVDRLQTFGKESIEHPNAKDTYKTRDYPVLEATTKFNMDGADDCEDIKIKAWFAEIEGEESRYEFLGAINYPYFGFDIDYIGFWPKLNSDGFFGNAKSILSDLKDSNIAQDALLNLALHSIYIRNVLTPIIKEGSELETVFLENRWQDGKPLVVDQMSDDVNKAIGFVQYPQINIADFQLMDVTLKRQDGDVTGVSGLMTGRESPSDPHAPASKTMALLQQSGINIRDYIRNFLPSFNQFIGSVMQLYYQMSQEGRKFKIGTLSKEVTGVDAFKDISRDEMIAKTNIQARAAAFAFDKAQEKQENMMFFQLFAQTPIAATQPEAYYKAFKILAKSWSPIWSAFAENDMLGKAEFEKKQMMVAMQAIKQLLEAQFQQKQITGVSDPINPQQAGNAVTEAQMLANNPAMAEEAKKNADKQ